MNHEIHHLEPTPCFPQFFSTLNELLQRQTISMIIRERRIKNVNPKEEKKKEFTVRHKMILSMKYIINSIRVLDHGTFNSEKYPSK